MEKALRRIRILARIDMASGIFLATTLFLWIKWH